MEKKFIFLTESAYEGSWQINSNCMNGFGTYTYPDCSEYRGYFRDGKFHGYGRLRLTAPHKFTVEGNFENGVLKEISYMWFHDGLTVEAKLDKDKKLSFEDWQYCSKSDRRFVKELIYGLEPVGPTSILTVQKEPRTLEKDTFDIEEGVYKQSSRFVTECVPPFKFTRFVNCSKEAEWIRKNCRRADVDLTEPNPAEEIKIIENNLNVQSELQERMQQKAKNIDPNRQYFYKLCEKERLEDGAECVIADADDDIIYGFSDSTSNLSFKDSSIKQDAEDLCHRVGEYQPDLLVPDEHNVHMVRRPTPFENLRHTVHFLSGAIQSPQLQH